MSEAPNPALALARELIGCYMEGCGWNLRPGNEAIQPLLVDDDECELNLLPGESVQAIATNLDQVIRLASEPVPLPATGRDRVGKQFAAQAERYDIAVFARAALALIRGQS